MSSLTVGRTHRVVVNTWMRAVDPRWPALGALIHHTIGIWPVVLDDETEGVLDAARGTRSSRQGQTLRRRSNNTTAQRQGAAAASRWPKCRSGGRSTGASSDRQSPRPIPGTVNAWRLALPAERREEPK